MSSRPFNAAAGGGAATENFDDQPSPHQQSQESETHDHHALPFRHDKIFESLFSEQVFPYFFDAFQKCDIDVGDVATATENSSSDSAFKIAITDDGFKKMAECYKLCNTSVDDEQLVKKVPFKDMNVEKAPFKKQLDDFLNSNRTKAAVKVSEDKAPAEVRKTVNPFSSRDKTQQEKRKKENRTCWGAMQSSLASIAIASSSSRPDPFFSFCFWLLNHCTIPHKSAYASKQKHHKCKGINVVCEFSKAPTSHDKFSDMVALIRFCHLLRFWHRYDIFAPKSQCIFELCFCSSENSMFNLCHDKETARSLQEYTKLITLDYLQPEARIMSPLTSRWILLEAGRSVKQWGHRSSHEFEKCEVDKELNCCERWRHLIYSYAVMALLYNEFNGNKQGPIGKYHFRDQCKIGQVGLSQEDPSLQKFVYASKATKEGKGEASDYLGHNIVALAVCKRGSVLRVSYNHNVLFSSTVDHAEERLIDGLFKDPGAFIPKNHAKIFKDDQRVDIEQHMKHISVYTSLEPCQQCSGKLHIAEVPEVIFCQRDWDIQLLQAQLYEKFRKSRSVPASNFDFSPYQELSTGYYNFQGDRRKTFFSLHDRQVATKTTMPYFLCTDYAQNIFSMGHKVFCHDLNLLFLGGDLTTNHRTDIEEVFSKEHGLFHANEWLEQAKSIREYRPSLDRKQKRILHDELCGSRNEWIELCHKRESSVIIRFDRNSSVTEHDIDRHFASLVDIKSIYLPREPDGSLKGTAYLVCISHAAARHLLSLFKLNDASKQGHLKQHFDANGQIAFKGGSNLSNIKKDFLKAAAQWLYINRRIQHEEFIVPYYWPSSLSSAKSKAQIVTLLLMQWHQERLEFAKSQRRLLQDREELAKVQSDLKKNMQKFYSINFCKMASRCDPAAELLDDKVMYVIKKNTVHGHTLLKWMGEKAPFKDIHRNVYAAVQDLVQLVIPTERLAVNGSFCNAKDVFAKLASASSFKPRAPSSPYQAPEGWTIVKDYALQMLKVFYECRDVDWIILQCTIHVHYCEEWMVQKRKTQVIDNALAQLRASAITCDIECECEIRRTNQATGTIDSIAAVPASRSRPSSFTKNTPRSLIRFGQQVFCFKANNEAQALRIKQMLPSLDAPNHTVLWSRKKPTCVTSISDGQGSTVSVIVREDVTDASVLQFLQKILQKNVIPSICGVSEIALQACDHRKIEWLDVDGDEVKCLKWNRRSFRFRSKISVEYQNYLDYSTGPCQNEDHRPGCTAHTFSPLMYFHDASLVTADNGQWERNCFYQPFSQPVLDLILLKGDFSAYRKLSFDLKKMAAPNLSEKALVSASESETCILSCIRLIVSGSDSETIALCVSLEDGVVDVLGKNDCKFKGCTIEMDQKCLANFLFSDVLMNQSVKNKFLSILECGKNFWGGRILFNRYKKMTDNDVKDIVDKFWKVLEIWSNRAALSVLEYTLPLRKGTNVPKNDGNSRHNTRMENVSCCYCGCNYVIPLSVKANFGDWDSKNDGSAFCCVSHVDFSQEVQTKLQLPIASFKKSDKEISKQAQDPARDKNLANLFRRIREIEKLLLLNISAGAQYILFFMCSETNKLSKLRLQCQFRRDKYDGPVHLSFCIEGPTVILCSKRGGEREGGMADPQRTWSLKAGLKVTISLSEPMDEFADFGTTLSVDPEFFEHETPLFFGLDVSNHKIKTRMTRVYGRLASAENGKENGIPADNEGNKLPAEWMRRLMEPEYYQCPRAVYPVVKFKLSVPENGTGHTYHTAAASPYFDEHGLPDKHSKQDVKPKSDADKHSKQDVKPKLDADKHSNQDVKPKLDADKHSKQDVKPKLDAASQALVCFREVLKAESKLNDLNTSLNHLNRQIGSCMNTAQSREQANSPWHDDVAFSGRSDPGWDDDEDQGSDDEDGYSTGLVDESSIPQGWVVLLRKSSEHGTWMELFHARRKTDPHIFEQSDIHRVVIELPLPKEKAVFPNISSTNQQMDSPAPVSTAAVDGDVASVVQSPAPFSRSPLDRLRDIDHIYSNSNSKKFIQPRLHFKSVTINQDQGSNVTFSGDALKELQKLKDEKKVDLQDSPLLFLAKSFIDHVISATASTNLEHSAPVPVCVFKQEEFPDDVSTFIFDSLKTKPVFRLVKSNMCSALFRSLSKLPLRLDLEKQIDEKQKHFNDALDILLMEQETKDGIKSENKDGGLFGALVACKTFNDTMDCLKLLEAFKYLCCSENLFHKIHVCHIDWLLQTGEELDRKCEFAAALKYYYAGKVYYSKLDEFEFHGIDATAIAEGFEGNPDGLYVTLCDALKKVAEENKDWADKHPGILLGLGTWTGVDASVVENIQLCHLQNCLCPRGAKPCLETVLQNATNKLGVHFHLNKLASGAFRSSDPQILLHYTDSTFSWSVPEHVSGETQRHEDLRNRFEQLFERLLPYSNQEAYEQTRETVHFQKVVLKRGTMSK